MGYIHKPQHQRFDQDYNLHCAYRVRNPNHSYFSRFTVDVNKMPNVWLRGGL